jgi:hypothetical protein
LLADLRKTLPDPAVKLADFALPYCRLLHQIVVFTGQLMAGTDAAPCWVQESGCAASIGSPASNCKLRASRTMASKEQLMSTTILQPTTVVNSGNNASAASWGAIFAGALAASALSLIMFILGIGLGLTSVSPWSGEGMSAEALGLSTIGWITFTSLVASALGGYIAGRLRTRWVSVDQDEVYFRDTAHGFLAWGLSTLITATLLTTVSANLAGATASVAADAAGTVAGTAVAAGGVGAGVLANDANGTGDAQPGGADAITGYFLDSLFRRGPSSSGTFTNRPLNQVQAAPAQDPQNPQAANEEAQSDQAPQVAADTVGVRRANSVDTQGAVAVLPEVTRIMARAIQQGSLAEADRTYVAQLVAEHTGMSPADAEARVNQVFTNMQTELREAETRARDIADEARAASAKVSLWFFVSLLVGAFIGSLVATYGGKQRDKIEVNV